MEIKGIRTSIALVISFIIFNIFIAIATNSYFLINKLKNDYFFTIELQNDKTLEEILGFEKILLENEKINSVKYISKEKSIEELKKELNIQILINDNPLPNSMIINVDDETILKEISENLDVNPMVRDIYIDEKFINLIKRNITVTNLIMIISLVLASGMYFPITTIVKESVIKDYMLFHIVAPKENRKFKLSINKSTIFFMFSLIIGNLIFLNMYINLRKAIQQALPTFTFQSFNEILLIDIIGNGVIIMLTYLSVKNLKSDGE